MMKKIICFAIAFAVALLSCTSCLAFDYSGNSSISNDVLVKYHSSDNYFTAEYNNGGFIVNIGSGVEIIVSTENGAGKILVIHRFSSDNGDAYK